MKFTLLKKDPSSSARLCELETIHSVIRTPVFMSVATRGAIRAMTMDDIKSIGFDIILANTYQDSLS